MEKYEVFSTVLKTIENDDIREFATSYLKDTPDWFYEVAASSSGLYHSPISLGPGGLARHTIGATKILNWMLDIESIGCNFTNREKDLMRVAIIVHDSRKQGEKESKKHTVFEHPLYAAQAVMNHQCSIDLPEEEKKYIAECIVSHMGQWNTNKRSKTELPKPTKLNQILVHLADYLSSRRELTIDFSNDNNIRLPERPTVETYRFTFGKYSGMSLTDVVEKHYDYIDWLRSSNYSREPLASLLKEV